MTEPLGGNILQAVLPNLIVIGAGKCGTTSLHRYLNLHPAIAMADAKELDFFTGRENWKRGLSWYESQFRPTQVRGESSPSYSSYPAYPGVPERMVSTVPYARLVYLVRDPIERVISSYRYRRWVMGWEHRDIDEVLADVSGEIIARSRYALQLEQYLLCFSNEQIMVVDSAELRVRTGQTLAQIFSFVGVDDKFTSKEFSRLHFETDGLQANALGRTVRNVAVRRLGQYRTRAIKRRVPSVLQRPLLSTSHVPQVRLDPGQHAQLAALFKEDVDRLRLLTGQRFETWSV
jgi:hypothetical protein